MSPCQWDQLGCSECTLAVDGALKSPLEEWMRFHGPWRQERPLIRESDFRGVVMEGGQAAPAARWKVWSSKNTSITENTLQPR